MEKRNVLTFGALLCLTLTSCGVNKPNNSSSENSSSSSDGKAEPLPIFYEDKDINIIRSMNEETDTPIVDKTISLRFFTNTPNVPYITVSKYFQEFFNTTLKKEKVNNTYKYSREDGDYIAFNALDDIFSAYGLRSFSEHPDFVSSTGKYFLKDNGIEYTTPTEGIVSLKNYSIDIKDGEDEAYVPLSFLSKLAGGFNQYNAQYNGKDIYVIDRGNQLGNGKKDVEYYASSYYGVLDDLTSPRPEDLAKYNYNELCFVFDNLRGYTSQLAFGDNNLLTLGLNGLLEKYYPTVRSYLLSLDKQEYYQGVFSLFTGLFDGGHTAMLSNSPGSSEARDNVTTPDEIADVLSSAGTATLSKLMTQTIFKSAKSDAFGIPISEYSSNPNFYYYDSATKTGMISFDHFEVDYEGWDKYYKGQGEVPVNTDTYAFVRKSFYQAKEDGAENLVIDLTSNGGGNSGALNGVVGLLNHAKADFEMNDTFNKYRITNKFLLDVNLDGEFNQLDEQELEQFDFNVGVLTSAYAFSCGNLLPSTLKCLGYKILGEKSGGGSCAIIIESTADGIAYAHSSFLCLSDPKGNNIDTGVPVDLAIDRIPISIVQGVELFSADNFFNFETLSEYLKTAYNE